MCRGRVVAGGGGLRAGIVTGQGQARLRMGLLAIGRFVAVGKLPDAAPAALPDIPAPAALSVALTLVIAVTAANLFHQGYWQRLWSARDTDALSRGALLGGVVTIAVVAVVGGLGILAAMSGADLGSPPIPFFALLADAPAWLALPALTLAIPLVAS